MKKLILLACMLMTMAGYAQMHRPSTVLIELYSSEGCDNCPIAAAFMHDIIRIADSTHSPVYVIDFHVDLWDRSGWKDVYSDTMYTNRLIKHATMVGQQAIFTPMVFVNGAGAVPGSAKKQIGAMIGMNLDIPYFMGVQTQAAWIAGKSALDITWKIDGDADSCELHFALVKSEITTNVTAGENAGKTLVHHNVVRKFKTVPLPAKEGRTELAVEAGTDLREYKLVAFIQSLRTGKVFATDELLFR